MKNLSNMAFLALENFWCLHEMVFHFSTLEVYHKSLRKCGCDVRHHVTNLLQLKIMHLVGYKRRQNVLFASNQKVKYCTCFLQQTNKRKQIVKSRCHCIFKRWMHVSPKSLYSVSLMLANGLVVRLIERCPTYLNIITLFASQKVYHFSPCFLSLQRAKSGTSPPAAPPPPQVPQQRQPLGEVGDHKHGACWATAGWLSPPRGAVPGRGCGYGPHPLMDERHQGQSGLLCRCSLNIMIKLFSIVSFCRVMQYPLAGAAD